MYLHFNNRRAKCKRKADAGKKAEYYWTWQVYTEEGEKTILHQGFSIGCELDDGYKFSQGQEWPVPLNDPRFTVKLPELKDGEERRVVTDLFMFESDSYTLEVKKVFTNAAANELWKIYEKVGKKKKETLKQFEKWLDESGEGFLEEFGEIVSGANALIPYLSLSKKVIPLIKAVIEMIKTNSDDFNGFNRIELFYRKEADGYRFRWLLNDGIQKDFGEQREPLYLDLNFISPSAKNWVVTKSFFQVILEP
jgi:hypothetical protein